MRNWLLAGLGAVAVGVTALLIAPSFSKARPAQDAQAQDGPKNTPLSIGREGRIYTENDGRLFAVGER